MWEWKRGTAKQVLEVSDIDVRGVGDTKVAIERGDVWEWVLIEGAEETP